MTRWNWDNAQYKNGDNKVNNVQNTHDALVKK